MSDFLTHIARSLGRDKPLEQLDSPPPAIDETFARLVDSNADLATRFITSATAAKMHVEPCAVEELTQRIAGHLARLNAKSVVLARCPICEKIGLRESLRSAGVSAEYWSDITLDASYDVDVGIGDVYRAVAETGSIVVRESAEQGRAVSLVPPTHFAIVRKSQIVPDLIDLLADVQRDGSGSGIVMITGPSKTADIEMNLVTGVHGPGEVVIFLIDSE